MEALYWFIDLVWVGIMVVLAHTALGIAMFLFVLPLVAVQWTWHRLFGDPDSGDPGLIGRFRS